VHTTPSDAATERTKTGMRPSLPNNAVLDGARMYLLCGRGAKRLHVGKETQRTVMVKPWVPGNEGVEHEDEKRMKEQTKADIR
jgi:hypothetical protein